MATLVSTGQITIVDTNDARPITAYMTADDSVQQVYTKDESDITYVPSWFNRTNGIQLNPKVYIGTTTGSSDVTNSLGSPKFSFSLGGTAIANNTTSTNFVNGSDVEVSTPFTVSTGASGTYLRIKGNLKASVGSITVFFEGDYTDPTTKLVSHVIAQITLNTVKTGTNAVYINTRGNDTIEVGVDVNGNTKTTYGYITAELIRTGNVIDTSGLTYKWYEDASTQITSSTAEVSTKYGFKSVASSAASTGLVTDLNANIPDIAGNDKNTIVIAPKAVTDIRVYRVDITDAESKTYSKTFVISDASDPYEVRAESSSGDKLQNGTGSTTVTPWVWNGVNKLTDYTNWSFTWKFRDKNGNLAAFVDPTKFTPVNGVGGREITANETGNSAKFTYTGTSYTFSAGEIIKCVKSTGEAYYYEVASSTTTSVTIRAPSTNTWLTFTNYPSPSATTDFVGGRLFACTGNGTTIPHGTRVTSGQTPIVITGDDIDVKGIILVEANRP